MRLRTALIGLGCSVAILIAGCSSPVAGVPEAQGGGGNVTTAPGGGGGGDGTGGMATTPATDGGGSTGGGSTDGGGSTGGGGLPTDLSGLPTDLSGLPTDLSELTNIPGLGGECMTVAGAVMAIGLLFAAPLLSGKALTQTDVDQAFQGLQGAPADIQPAIKTLHDAASQAVGKSPSDAMTILGSDPVTKAMDQLSTYVDSKCGSS